MSTFKLKKMAPVKMGGPATLYNLSVNTVAENYQILKKEVKASPGNVQFDIYHRLYEEGKLCMLSMEFCDLEVFARMLKATNKRLLLLQSFQSLMNHGTCIAKELSLRFTRKCEAKVEHGTSEAALDSMIELGLRLGGFLSEAGWLLHVQTVYCRFPEADATFQAAVSLVDKMRALGDVPNLAGLYAEFSVLYFFRSQYNEAYQWSEAALREVHPNMPSSVLVDVLRQASKACVVKRKFRKAELLVKQAVYLAREVFGCSHPKYSDSLLDYGFYLLNYDSIGHSVQVYVSALDIRVAVFGKWNLHVAVAHEDLAYALYVHEYSSGRFSDARENAEKAINIMEHVLPEDHLLLASSKRVKALILEEIAIDTFGNDTEKGLLNLAEQLHMTALKLTMAAFGETNTMHLKAIEIKEKLLGLEDYEVALSLGHLASLYNYHIKDYLSAEQLYHRSIAIGQKLFGQGYSGLEYDYRGLLHVYTQLQEVQKVADYTRVLHRWKMLRDQQSRFEVPPLDPTEHPRPVQDVVNSFFCMD
ncbi:hypothetical protein B566_EDAN003486 [Ephemera danica]|nr:hypothetical protein B566_EDAN003486 [Ephemera danica]